MSEDAKKPETQTQNTAAPTSTTPKKKDNSLKIVLIVVAVVVGLFILSGIAMSMFAFGFLKKQAGVVKVNDANGSVTIGSSNGDSTITGGKSVSVPDGFPSDAPIYKPSTLTYAVKTGGKNYSVSGKTSDTPEQVMNYYKQELPKQGWGDEATYETSSDRGMSKTFRKADKYLVVTSGASSDSTDADKTTFTLSVTTLQNAQ